jgi:hypothetical protein
MAGAGLDRRHAGIGDRILDDGAGRLGRKGDGECGAQRQDWHLLSHAQGLRESAVKVTPGEGPGVPFLGG